jgi:hypothetical protein
MPYTLNTDNLGGTKIGKVLAIIGIIAFIVAMVVLINQGINLVFGLESLDNFLNYTNDVMNFTIQHPSNWQVKESTESPLKESTESPHGRVWFELSGRSLPIFAVDTEKVEPHFDSNTKTLKNTSLQQLVQHELDEMSSDSSEFRNFDLIRQNKVTVGGNSGWKMEFAGKDSFYLFEICTIANGEIYILTYQDYPLKVPETLPLANKMVESFQLKTE